MKKERIEAIEVTLLLEAMYERYGYDFRSYTRASIERRIQQFLSCKNVGRISDLIPGVMHDKELFSEMARYFSIGVTEMFRDPFVYRALREKAVPILRTFPFCKVWHAGCATGEEVYSMAILLKEEGLDERATLFGTDFNDESLAQARAGVYKTEKIQEFTRNYQEAGGKKSFSDYYHAQNDLAVLDSSLRDRTTFANHNLTVDTSFGEMDLVFCRNTLIYFNSDLQNRVLKLIDESLVRGGLLCLGTMESLQFTAVADGYEELDARARIYRKILR